ncbi:MAG TPA: hypothetical protein VFE34_10645 [Dongiaceae bacterium]|jgi:hypothetical protein|nr:hypothetical protein [Dongiaceae bacterium]
MERACIFGAIMMAALPALAEAQDVLQPKYPPGFNCANVPAGSQREACQNSHLSPKVVPNPNNKSNIDRSMTGGAMQSPGTISPPTVPNEPGSENRDTGPGGNNGVGGN